jgi:hypothetical protein
MSLEAHTSLPLRAKILAAPRPVETAAGLDTAIPRDIMPPSREARRSRRGFEQS